MVGASPSFLPFPMVVALTVTLGAEGGGQTMIDPFFAQLQAKEIDCSLSLDEAEFLTDAIPLG